MKIAIGIIISVLWFLFIGQTRITLHPFSISIEYWERALGYLLIAWGIGLLSVGEYNRGRIKGQNEVLDALTEQVQNKQKEV